MTRKLASIRRISEIRPIEGADNIVIAAVDGWQLITNKENGFKVGDLCVYFEIDSWMPHSLAPFLTKPGSSPKIFNGVEGQKLKTIRLRGQLSQGLILPLTDDLKEFGEGTDVTELLGIQKYEKPIPAQLQGKARGLFPAFLRKTDQERVQNILSDLIRHPGMDADWEVTLKLDGSSMTVYNSGESVGVCSRNLDLHETEDNAFWQVARKKRLIEQMEKFPGYAIQGELMGPGVQGNRENLKELNFYLYDVWSIKDQRYLGKYERWDFLNHNDFEVEDVPYIESTTLAELDKLEGNTLMEKILFYADRPSMHHSIAEGVVFKLHNGSMSFKAISNRFLLKEKD